MRLPAPLVRPKAHAASASPLARPRARFDLRTVFLLCATWLLSTADARAYTIASPISDGCHESITSEALRTVRGELASAGPLPTSRNDRALIDDLPFPIAHDLREIGAAALLLAVRDNDLKGGASTDLSSLAETHGNPKAQREHCLRGADDRGPEGSRTALEACRAFIRERVTEALDGLDDEGAPDPAKRTKLPVYLALRHEIDAMLPSFYVNMGKALHTIEDSFTHTYRSTDGLKITVVTNWLHQVDGELNEPVDGPAHRGELDECKELDELRTQRRELALQAATETLRATLQPGLDRAQKLAQLELILNKYLSYQPGCTHDNGWCDAPESRYGNSKIVKCSLGESGQGAGAFAVLVGMLLWRRRRMRGAALLMLACLVCYIPQARADGSRKQGDESAGASDGVRERTDGNGEQLVYGAYAGGAGSVDHGALAFQVGGRLRFRKNWTFGLGTEWNPFISDPRVYDVENFQPGVFNGYGTVIFRLPLANESFNLRASLDFGFSTLLMDLYGAPRGSTGLYGAISPLGLEWKMASVPYLIINPLGIALPAPQLNGVPYLYTQYRFTIGIELYQRK